MAMLKMAMMTRDGFSTLTLTIQEELTKKTRGLYKCIENRRQAIRFAMRIAWKSDVIIIAGKGHETYQEVENGKKLYFDDKEIVRKIAAEMPDKNI